jgi:hypothetical protein
MVVAREEQFTGRRYVLAGHGRQFRGEILIAKIDPDRRCVCVEQLHRSFKIGDRSSWSYLERSFRHSTINAIGMSQPRFKGPHFTSTFISIFAK